MLNIQCRVFGNFQVEDKLKDNINCAKRIPVQKQTLSIDGRVLEGDYKLTDNGINKHSTIILSLQLGFSREMLLNITLPSAGEVRPSAKEDDTVDDLKKQARRMCGLFEESYRVVFNGKLLEGYQTLAYGAVAYNPNLTAMQYMSRARAN
ncbi:unnamed protein product [Dibothriocephalus latus]|uniref:Ubiquitin-like domain-containing protein n=1 Tax=Dibothriocephalus latus TaxID=60516 RepID=A0A3P7NVD7_DIBLA|nr:unnamed protein product [Dibothriocephalus latus]